MTTQPEALRLADDLVPMWDNGSFEREDAEEAAAELRRQHERIRELEQALDKAIRALGTGLIIPTSEIAKLREVRRD